MLKQFQDVIKARNELNKIINDHQDMDIDDSYKQLAYWLAFELADNREDVETFNKLYYKHPKQMKLHFELTRPCLHWNFTPPSQ